MRRSFVTLAGFEDRQHRKVEIRLTNQEHLLYIGKGYLPIRYKGKLSDRYTFRRTA